MGRRGRSDPAMEIAEPDDDRDADSLENEPVPRARRSSAETAKLGSEAQTAIRMERIETAIDGLRVAVEECRRDMRTMIKALEGRTKVSERCLGILQQVIGGIMQPSRGLLLLSALAATIVAPGSLLMVANSEAGMKVADAIVARLLGPALVAAPVAPAESGP